MILYEGGEDIPTRKNSSRSYRDGSKHKTTSCGSVVVLAQEDRYTLGYNKLSPSKNYIYFIVQFEDGTKRQALMTNILRGNIKNPSKPSSYGVGFIGQGKWGCSENGKNTKEYALWSSMLMRCYSKIPQKCRETYVGCTVHERWHNFQNFAEDIQSLTNYLEWKQDIHKRNKYELDKDIKVKGNKVYSKDACQFTTSKENSSRGSKKQTLTGITYIATRLEDDYKEEFTNQTEFAEKYNLNNVYISRCLRRDIPTSMGWLFKIKEEKRID